MNVVTTRQEKKNSINIIYLHYTIAISYNEILNQ